MFLGNALILGCNPRVLKGNIEQVDGLFGWQNITRETGQDGAV
jgi:hypothetical protein